MLENQLGTSTGEDCGGQNGNNCCGESICIDAMRVYDSCADKDCLEDLPVFFQQAAQQRIDNALNVRLRDVDVITVYINLEPAPFHRGFYTVEMTFFFEIMLDVFSTPASCPETVCGLTLFSKKVVLYGSEGNVKIYSSDSCSEVADNVTAPARNLPKASVQVATPIALAAELRECPPLCVPCCRIPDSICRKFGGSFVTNDRDKTVYVTIGLFTIVQIERNVQMLIPAYDFCIPEKECVASSDNPCELFSRIDFPTDEFFPPKVTDLCDENERSFRSPCCGNGN